jgi:hypothetical protein
VRIWSQQRERDTLQHQNNSQTCQKESKLRITKQMINLPGCCDPPDLRALVIFCSTATTALQLLLVHRYGCSRLHHLSLLQYTEIHLAHPMSP